MQTPSSEEETAMVTTKAQASERAEFLDKIREHVKPGDTVYTVLRHVSKSGMARDISLILLGKDGPWDFSGWAAKALGLTWQRDGNGGIRVGGCGMDMGFHLVYELSSALWSNGHGCTGEGCLSNDHHNGDRDYTPHGLSNENGQPENREPYRGEKLDGCVNHWHRDGGYALRQRWL